MAKQDHRILYKVKCNISEIKYKLRRRKKPQVIFTVVSFLILQYLYHNNNVDNKD